MAYTNNDIAARAREMAPNTASDKDSLLYALCAAADAELKSRLKADAVPEEIEELFVTAAGMLALAMLSESSEDKISYFEAGSLSVSLEGGTSAYALRRQAESLLKGYLESGDFAFLGVSG